MWRGWVIAPHSGTTAAQAQKRFVRRLRAAGWTPMTSVPPVASGFRSLCRSGLYATVFTADEADQAEAAQEFVNEAPLDPNQLQIVIGRTDGCSA
jgi:hypothetical protein